MSRKVRVGLLVFAGLALFFVALMAIASRSFSFTDTFYLRATYNNVAGLQAGAPVQFQGVLVGRVQIVSLPTEPGEPILVRMAIIEEARPLIRENTQAQIKSQGLIGNTMMVVLVNPSDEEMAEVVDDGDTIIGVEPFDFYEITDDARAAAQQFQASAGALQEILQDIQTGEGTLARLIYDPSLYESAVQTARETQQLLSALGEDAEAVTELARSATQEVETLLSKINEGDGTLARLINEDAVYQQLLATADTLQQVSGSIRAVTSSAENAANWATLGTYRFAQLMEAAKHNFLFKGYFERHGYVDQAPFEVRAQALQQTYQELEAWQNELDALEHQLEERAAALQRPTEDEAPATAPADPADPADPAGAAPAGSPPSDSLDADDERLPPAPLRLPGR